MKKIFTDSLQDLLTNSSNTENIDDLLREENNDGDREIDLVSRNDKAKYKKLILLALDHSNNIDSEKRKKIFYELFYAKSQEGTYSIDSLIMDTEIYLELIDKALENPVENEEILDYLMPTDDTTLINKAFQKSPFSYVELLNKLFNRINCIEENDIDSLSAYLDYLINLNIDKNIALIVPYSKSYEFHSNMEKLLTNLSNKYDDIDLQNQTTFYNLLLNKVSINVDNVAESKFGMVGKIGNIFLTQSLNCENKNLQTTLYNSYLGIFIAEQQNNIKERIIMPNDKNLGHDEFEVKTNKF